MNSQIKALSEAIQILEAISGNRSNDLLDFLRGELKSLCDDMPQPQSSQYGAVIELVGEYPKPLRPRNTLLPSGLNKTKRLADKKGA